MQLLFKIYLYTVLVLLCVLPSYAQTQVSFNTQIFNEYIGTIYEIYPSDFNHDYQKDFIINFDNQTIVFLLNFGNDTYTIAHQINFDTYLNDLQLIDFDRDGKLDMVYDNFDTIFLQRQICNYAFDSKEFLYRKKNDPGFIEYSFEDLNFDHKLELVIKERLNVFLFSGNLSIYYLDENNTYPDASNISIEFSTDSHHEYVYYFADFNKDNAKELVEYIDPRSSLQKTAKIHTFNETGLVNSILFDSIPTSTTQNYRDIPSITSTDIPDSPNKKLFFGFDDYLYSYLVNQDLSYSKKIDTFPSNVNFYQISVKDINNDGHDDLKSYFSYVPSIHSNSPKTSIPLLNPGQYGHFDNNSNIDAIILNNNRTSFSIYKDFNGLTFSDTINMNLEEPGTFSLNKAYHADINNDNFIDIYGTNRNFNTINVLENNGDATFNNAAKIRLSGTGTIEAVGHGDFNSDGHTDYVGIHRSVSNGIGSRKIAIHLNDGNYIFESVELNTIPFEYYSAVKADDFDGDLDDDLILMSNSEYLIYTNDGFGNFDLSTTLKHDMNEIILADIDKDGSTDIFTYSTNADKDFLIYLNNGLGTFTPSFPFDDIVNFYPTKLFDVNKDALLDAIVFNPTTSHNLSYFKNIGSGNFELTTHFTGLENLVDISNYLSNANIFEAIDLNDDGFVDIIGSDNQNIKVFYGSNTLDMTEGSLDQLFIITAFKNNFLLNDFDGDNDIDYFCLDSYRIGNFMLTNNLYQSIASNNENGLSNTNCHNFNLGQVFEEIDVKIINSNGQIIKTDILYNTDNVNYQFRAPKGIYILQASTNTNEVFSFKIGK